MSAKSTIDMLNYIPLILNLIWLPVPPHKHSLIYTAYAFQDTWTKFGVQIPSSAINKNWERFSFYQFNMAYIWHSKSASNQLKPGAILEPGKGTTSVSFRKGTSLNHGVAMAHGCNTLACKGLNKNDIHSQEVRLACAMLKFRDQSLCAFCWHSKIWLNFYAFNLHFWPAMREFCGPQVGNFAV